MPMINSDTAQASSFHLYLLPPPPARIPSYTSAKSTRTVIRRRSSARPAKRLLLRNNRCESADTPRRTAQSGQPRREIKTEPFAKPPVRQKSLVSSVAKRRSSHPECSISAQQLWMCPTTWINNNNSRVIRRK